MVISTFTIANNYKLSILLSRWLRMEQKGAAALAPVTADGEHAGADIILLGYFLNAEALARELDKQGSNLVERMLVIDFNLQNHAKIKVGTKPIAATMTMGRPTVSGRPKIGSRLSSSWTISHAAAK